MICTEISFDIKKLTEKINFLNKQKIIDVDIEKENKKSYAAHSDKPPHNRFLTWKEQIDIFQKE